MSRLQMRATCGAFVAIAGVLSVTFGWSEEPKSSQSSSQNAVSAKTPPEPERVSLTIARERAKVMHDIYAATLDVMHHHYFRRDQAVLPARAMEDVFEEMSRQSTAQANWISVNTKAMSINHEPETDFEKQAAKELAAGKDSFELVENGYYHRAGQIPLGSGCVSCHTKLFVTSAASVPTSPRVAGLVIRIPVHKE